MNKVVKKMGTSHEQVFNKSCTSHEQIVKKSWKSIAQVDQVMWSCPGCSIPGDVMGNRDTQQHVLTYLAYEEFRDVKDLTEDKDIVKYFEQVIQKRLNDA